MNAISIIGVVSAFCLVFLWLLALCAEKGVHPFRRVRQGFRHLPAWEKALLSIFVGVWIAFASVKDGTNGVSQVEGETDTVTQVEGGTNQIENGEWIMEKGEGTNSILHSPFSILHFDGGPLMLGRFGRPNLSLATPQSITDDDIAQMWQIGRTTDATAFAEPTANAVTNLDWRDYGGMSDSLRIKPNGWWFPFGNRMTTGLTVFENGDFRPNVKTHFFPPPFDAQLSLLPRMNWSLLSGGESVFWHEQTPSNSLVLTWHNALYNRDVNAPTNFQAELFADGRFDYRYPDRTVQYAPVFPFDWDGDGLENSVDPEPLVAGPDAHGTNAEWYNRVCGNVFAATQAADGLDLAPRTGDVNTNAYFFVDIVAESLTPIHFIADGASDLGNPVVVARAGEVCRVPLLIGATYCVSSSVPFQVYAPAEAAVQMMRTIPETVGMINWPVPVSFTSEGGWTRPSVPEDLQRRLSGTFSWSDGCCMLVSGDAVSFQCHGCRCSGCNAYANYSYSGYHLTCPGPSCGCTGEVGGNAEEPYVETPSGARISVRFGKRALLFENAYEDSPGVTVARRSSPVSLTVEACGGSNGGTLSLSTRKFDRLVRAAGDALPTSPIPLTAGTNVSYSVTYEALSRSDGADDISLTARLVEEGSPPLRLDCTIRLTAVELSLTADKRAPENACPHRHGYGVRELVKAEQIPTSPRVEWHAPDWIVTNGLPTSLVCPLVATNCGGSVKACLGDAEYVFDVSVYNPTGVFSHAEKVEWFYRPRVPGREIPLGIPGTGMKLPIYVGPMDVSFEGIAISERPCETGRHTGYYDHPSEMENWSHTRARGAGDYHQVKTGNLWFVDEPCCVIDPNAHSLSYGVLVWDIPIGWNEIGTAWWHDSVAEVPGDVKQIEIMASDGTVVISKLGQWTMRTTNDWCVVNGATVKEGR